MSTYSNQLQPALQNLLQRIVQFFHPRSSCTTMHISTDVQRITLNASCMTISGERTEQLDIICRITGFTSDFLSFTNVELIRFFHGALQLHCDFPQATHSYLQDSRSIEPNPVGFPQCMNANLQESHGNRGIPVNPKPVQPV